MQRVIKFFKKFVCRNVGACWCKYENETFLRCTRSVTQTFKPDRKISLGPSIRCRTLFRFRRLVTLLAIRSDVETKLTATIGLIDCISAFAPLNFTLFVLATMMPLSTWRMPTSEWRSFQTDSIARNYVLH